MSAESEFWSWFREHEDELFDFESDREGVFDRLAQAMVMVNADLTFEFGPRENGVREFVISAGGLKSGFPAVKRLFEARPPLRRFRVTAFRPRRAEIGDIEMGAIRIRASDVYYHLCKDDDPKRVGILLFLPGFAEERRSEYGQIGFLFLDEALGEYDMETRVGFVEMMSHDSKHLEGAHPIAEMAAHFDAVIRSKAQQEPGA